MNSIQSINLIKNDPKMHGGHPYVARTGLRVIDILMASIFHDRALREISANYEVCDAVEILHLTFLPVTSG